MPILEDVVERIDVAAGVDKDNTALATLHYTDASNIRFYNNKPQKLGGNVIFTIDNSKTILGSARTLYTQLIQDKTDTLVGTHLNLYNLFSTELTNITPLVTATTAIANSLDSHFQTLGNDPVATVNTSTTLTISSTAHVLIAGDTVVLAGAAAVNGVPAIEINATHIVRTTTANDYTIIVATAATSTGSGGGASVTEASAVITVNQTAHGFPSGNRVKILAAATFAGIPDSEINVEHVIRNSQTNSYDILVITEATSSVSSGGGASTTVQGQIADGSADFSIGIGYGMGKYGVGRYGVSKTSTNLRGKARIYSNSKFGDNVVFTAGDQTNLYIWDGDISIAPIIIANAPTAINYVFTNNNIIVTFGASGVVNRLQWSDVGDATDWTPTDQNQSRTRDLNAIGELVSHAELSRTNILFTENRVLTMRYVNLPLIWDIQDIGANDGIIAQNARVVHNNVCYWMGNKDFFLYNGGVVQSIPSNSSNKVNYVREFVFNDLNSAQKGKCFAWFNRDFNEVWFHYPSAGSNECDKVVKFNVNELHWTPNSIARTAGENPINASANPLLIDTSNNVRKHESGVNDDTSAISWTLDSPFYQVGSKKIDIDGVIPDSVQTGDITVDSFVRDSIQDTASETTNSNTVTPTTGELIGFSFTGRNWQFKWSGNALNGNWRMGDWYQLIKETGI